jgi:hypothetical protein
MLQKGWLNKVEGEGASLQSFLIMPIQRLARYVLLLRQLIKHSKKSHLGTLLLLLLFEKSFCLKFWPL